MIPERLQKPNLSWLSTETFAKCERQWLYSYHRDFLIGEESFTFMAQARLAPEEALVGQIVDAVITNYMYRRKRDGDIAYDWEKAARRVLTKFDRYSSDWVAAVEAKTKWPKSGMQPIDRYYYGNPLSEEAMATVLSQVDTCLENFQALGILARILEYPPESWLVDRPLQKDFTPMSFHYEDIPISVKMDFAIKAEDLCWIFDWKTGNPYRKEKDTERQLHWYALYAHHAWQIPIENIRLSPVWLGESTCTYDLAVKTTQVEALAKLWRKTISHLRKNLEAGREDSSLLLDLFPMTGNLSTCSRCKFHACPGFARLRKS